VYRGVKLDLSTKFKKGDEPVWWSVTSTSTTMEVLQSKEFCGDEGPRTVFVVQVFEMTIAIIAIARARHGNLCIIKHRDSAEFEQIHKTSRGSLAIFSMLLSGIFLVSCLSTAFYLFIVHCFD
jgi:hypothetical protein